MNIHPEFHRFLARHDKEQLLGQRGIVIWLCGLSGSGKSTIANAAERVLHQQKRFSIILDGDNIRTGLNSDLGFTDQDRLENIRRIAETAKVLSPEKRVFLANADAGCPMADQMDKAMIEAVRKDYPGYAVVCYINTTSELKTVCDVCVTSSSAVEICKKLPQKDILVIPYQNLAQYVAGQLPEKNIRYLDGCCPYHAAMTAADVAKVDADLKLSGRIGRDGWVNQARGLVAGCARPDPG